MNKLLVLINPFSGQKLAESYWEEAEPILRKANLDLEIVKT